MTLKARIESAENGYVVWLSKRISEKDEAANRYVFLSLSDAINAIDKHFMHAADDRAA
jgi:hypothetical protein